MEKRGGNELKSLKKRVGTIEKLFALLDRRNGSHIHCKKRKIRAQWWVISSWFSDVESAYLLNESDMKVGTLLAGYPIAYHIANLDLGSIFGLFSDLQTGTRDPLNRLASYVFHFALPYLINDSELRVSRAYLYVFL